MRIFDMYKKAIMAVSRGKSGSGIGLLLGRSYGRIKGFLRSYVLAIAKGKTIVFQAERNK